MLVQADLPAACCLSERAERASEHTMTIGQPRGCCLQAELDLAALSTAAAPCSAAGPGSSWAADKQLGLILQTALGSPCCCRSAASAEHMQLPSPRTKHLALLEHQQHCDPRSRPCQQQSSTTHTEQTLVGGAAPSPPSLVSHKFEDAPRTWMNPAWSASQLQLLSLLLCESIQRQEPVPCQLPGCLC